MSTSTPLGLAGMGRRWAWLAALALSTATLLCPAPAALAQVNFSGPTNFNAGSDPFSVAVGDFNADGDPDLAVANLFSSDVSVLLGGTGGGFGAATNFAAGYSPTSVAVGDFNGDGDPDLVVGHYGVFSDVSVLLGGAGGSFGAPTKVPTGGAYPLSVAVGDFNGDGDPDLAVTVTDYDSFNDVSVLLGGPGGSFGAPTNFPVGNAPQSVAVGDFNADGDADLAVANYSSNDVSVLLGDGDGYFFPSTNFPAGSRPYSVAVGDFDADGDADLAVANRSSNDVSVLLGDGDGSFEAATNFPAGNGPYSVAVGDFNADGDPDLAVANDLSNDVSVLLGGTGGSFGAPISFPAGTNPTSVAVGDFDADADADLAVSNESSNNVSVLLNTPPPPDGDNDGVPDADDNCPNDANPGQTNTDGDNQGDACDPDDDGDNVDDASDECPTTAGDADGCPSLESHGASKTAAPVYTGPVLDDGVQYTVTVRGTYSAYVASQMAGLGGFVVCGTPEPAPLFASPNPTNGPVGQDPEFTFATPSKGKKCSAKTAAALPRHETKVRLNTEGSAYTTPTADSVGTTPAGDHAYAYTITGHGQALKVKIQDSNYADNYGRLAIKVENG